MFQRMTRCKKSTVKKGRLGVALNMELIFKVGIDQLGDTFNFAFHRAYSMRTWHGQVSWGLYWKLLR